MLIAAWIAALVAVYLIQYRIFRDHSFDGVRYDVTLSTDEVFEGEDVFLYEEILNVRLLPLPFVKVDTRLPDGLRYRLIEEEGEERRGTFAQSVQSVFVLRPHQRIRRTWRVNCAVRGEYSIGEVVLVTNDLVGFDQQSKQITVKPSAKNRLVVLPRTVGLERNFTASRYISGDTLSIRGLVSDPLRLCGVREYAPGDPMKRINWKSTAAHGALMVNVEEFTRRHAFNLVMNMNSRDIERVPGPPAIPAFVEGCVTVTASILDAVSSENIRVRLITNTVPPAAGEDMLVPVERIPAEEEDGEDEERCVFVSPPLAGKNQMLDALRLLAMLPMEISVSVEKMLDDILDRPTLYAPEGNLLVVSSYLSERMIHFFYGMRRQGIDVIFYVTNTVGNAAIIPDDVPVFYKTHWEE